MIPNPIYYDYLVSPVGQIEIGASEAQLLSVKFSNERLRAIKSNEVIRHTQHQLSEYFAGKRFTFELPLTQQGTDFQKQVWRALQSLPYASTCSYSDIASNIGNPKAVRAVGAANGRNPISIIIPCHRVVGANGSLTGYAWGVDIKAALLKHEQRFKRSP